MPSTKPHTQQYYLDIKFGTAKDTDKDPTRLPNLLNFVDELYIIQDINRFLPTFHLKTQDTGRYYSSFLPYDRRQNRIRIAFNRNGFPDGASIFDFDMYRRFPSSDLLYDVEGVLQIRNFFRPSKTRGFSGNIKNNLTTIANELGVDQVDISPSLSYDKDILQTNLSNSEFLQYLRDNLIGKQNEAPYFCYITSKSTINGMKKVFVFKSLDEFYKEEVKYTFSDSPTATYDEDSGETFYPILDFKAFDNYKLLETSGCKKMDYGYYNYDTGAYTVQSLKVVGNQEPLDDFYSLTRYFSIDQDSSEDNVGIVDTGRGNAFTSDFKGKSKNRFFTRINDLSKFWITTWGLEDIYPGDIVRLQFFEDTVNMLSQQYHGFWMVERVIHMLGQLFGTRLLLTRNGINTVNDTMLVRVSEKNVKK